LSISTICKWEKERSVNGRLIRLIKVNRPDIEAVALDVFPTMLKSARDNFAGDSRI
jgi:hypothetical protein